MTKIRVLIVDDSVVIRRLLSDIISAEPDFEVVGTAPNGRIALAKLPLLCPDVVTLDIEMPELDGLATLPELRKAYPKLPVIMFSTLTERGAVATLDALSRGATDYVAKPANVGSISAGTQSIKHLLIPKIRALCSKAPEATNSKVVDPSLFDAPPMRLAPLKASRADVVVIGSSTGGPQALTAVLTALPADFPVGVVVVQHMLPVFTKHLAARLDIECTLSVAEAMEGDIVEPGRILIAPGDFHVELECQAGEIRCRLQQGPPENSCRPAVDVLFRSAAAAYGSGCVGVVLTGMGKDGLCGAQSIVERGGAIIAQDQETSVVWGMPRAVVEAGLPQHVLPLSTISSEILRRVQFGRRPVLSR
jgi:two-component system chemotaxis response regulator CheB